MRVQEVWSIVTAKLRDTAGQGRSTLIHHPVYPVQQEFIFVFFMNKIDQHLIYSSKMTLSKSQCSGKQ